MQSSSNASRCQDCVGRQISPGLGIQCSECPIHSYSDQNSEFCLLDDIFSINAGAEKQYYSLQKLIGLRESDLPGYNRGICYGSAASSFCYNTLYGPIQNEKEYYYVSVGNPSILDLKTALFKDQVSQSTSYAFAILPQQEQKFTQYQTSQCSSDKVIISLGSRLSKISVLEKKIWLNYSDGSICDQQNQKPYSSALNLVCDTQEGDGYPTFQSQEGKCHYVFKWKTQYACPLCSQDTSFYIEGDCINGKRLVTYLPYGNCVVFNGIVSKYEDCSAVKDEFSRTPMIVLALVLGTLFILTIVLCFFTIRTKRKYKQLIEETSKYSSSQGEEGQESEHQQVQNVNREEGKYSQAEQNKEEIVVAEGDIKLAIREQS